MKRHILRTWRRATCMIGVLALCLLSTSAHAAPQLLKPHGTMADGSPPGVATRGKAVRFDLEAMLALRPRDEVELTLPNAKKHAYIFELAQSHGDGIHSWIGRSKEKGSSHRAIITTGPGGSYGALSTPDGEFRLVPGNGHDWLINMADEQRLAPTSAFDEGHAKVPPKGKRAEATGAPDTYQALPGVNSVFLPKATPTPQHVVDLMIVYSRGVAQKLGGNLMTRLYFLVTRANTTFADSEVAITLRLVNATMVDYDDAIADSTALEQMSPTYPSFNATAFGNIEAIRSSYGADMVTFLRDGAAFGGNGAGWVGSSTPDANYMYSVTSGCIVGCEWIFIHQLGHNMGSKHSRPDTAVEAGGTSTYPQGAYAYSYGHYFCASGTLTCNPTLPNNTPGGCSALPQCSTQDPANFSTIMSLFQGSAEKIYRFSNAALTCSSAAGPAQPCGIASGADSANDALSMNNNRAAISALKGTVVPASPPGSLQFSASTYSALETGGNLTLTVTRTGGTTGAVTVQYATSNGSATAGSDYTTRTGTLSWNSGDGATKTITVPITADAVAEGNETFKVTLSNPAGTTGVYLGYPAEAISVILSPWPAGGTMPAGFTTSGGALAWTAETDQAFEGTHSLRSAQALTGDNTFSTQLNSDLGFTGNFTAGSVAFAYRISSFTNAGKFEFRVDGNVVFSDTGESGWKLVSFPVTAGTHTLQWRFANTMPTACNSPTWNPPAPGGANCADRVWLDAVSLPLATGGSTATVVLSSSQNPSNANAAVTFTATLSGASGTPTGTVDFRSSGTTISGCGSVAIAAGTAACTTTSLTPGTHQVIAVYSGNGTYGSSNSNTVSQAVNAAPTGRAHSDFNGDARSDVLWRNRADGSVYQWQLNGLAVVSEGFMPSVSAEWTANLVGDLTGDGRADVLFRRDLGGENYVWGMDGLGITTQGFLPSVPAGWTVAGGGDFNGDGRADILWRNGGTGQNYVWLMNGFEVVNQGFLPDVGGPWIVASVADVDGDARADVLWHNSSSGDVYVWAMNGLSIAMQGFLPPVSDINWEIQATPDVNGDGRADVFWRNRTTGDNYLWLLNGLTVTSQGFMPSVPDTGWRVVGYGDYNGDGRGDIFWRKATTGMNYQWQLNGFGITAEGFLPQVASEDWAPVKK